jgi:hypothetical protein
VAQHCWRAETNVPHHAVARGSAGTEGVRRLANAVSSLYPCGAGRNGSWTPLCPRCHDERQNHHPTKAIPGQGHTPYDPADRAPIPAGEDHRVQKAENDLTAAGHELKLDKHCPTDTVCFHTRQCIEKYSKSLLVWSRVDFPKTHDLNALARLLPDPRLPKSALRRQSRV